MADSTAFGGLLGGILHGAAGAVDDARQRQRDQEDKEMEFRRHMLDVGIQSVQQGNSPPEYLPQMLQDYAKTISSAPRARQKGMAGFKGATQMPQLPGMLMSLMGGGQNGQAGSPPSSAGAAPQGTGANAAQAASPSAPPPGPAPDLAGTGGVAEAAGGLSSLTQTGAAVPPATAAPTPPPVGGPTAPGAVPTPPAAAGGFRFYTPAEKAQMSAQSTINTQNLQEKARRDSLIQLLKDPNVPQEIKNAELRKEAGGYIFPGTGTPQRYFDPQTKQFVSWYRHPTLGIPVGVDGNPVPDDVMQRLVPANEVKTSTQVDQSGRATTSTVIPGQSAPVSRADLGVVGKGFAPAWQVRPGANGTFVWFKTRGPGAGPGTAPTDTGVAAPPQAEHLQQVDSVVAAQQAAREIMQQVNQEAVQARADGKPFDIEKRRDEIAQQMGLPNFAAVRQQAAQPSKRAQRTPAGGPPPPATGGVIYARDPQGKLHKASAGTKLPAGWRAEAAPQGQ